MISSEDQHVLVLAKKWKFGLIDIIVMPASKLAVIKGVPLITESGWSGLL